MNISVQTLQNAYWNLIHRLGLADILDIVIVAVVLYEALRQNDFAGLEKQGELHGDIKWSDVEHAGA